MEIRPQSMRGPRTVPQSMRALVMMKECLPIVGCAVMGLWFPFITRIILGSFLSATVCHLVIALMIFALLAYLVFALPAGVKRANRIIAVLERGVAVHGVLLSFHLVNVTSHRPNHYALSLRFTPEHGATRIVEFTVNQLSPGGRRFYDAALISMSRAGRKVFTEQTTIVPEGYDPDDPATRIEEVLFYDHADPSFMVLPLAYDADVRYNARDTIVSDHWAPFVFPLTIFAIVVGGFALIFALFMQMGFFRH
ncbi:MAG TPA: hypothetical protein VHV83_19115 [Armatimonadota bacterium]|nr:hypothetical protein [Armatimonadota bacterium]